MLILNDKLWMQVVEQANRVAEAKGRQDVVRAIAKAAKHVESTPYVEYDVGTHTALIASDSGHSYTSNGTCYDEVGAACLAWGNGRICYHRVLAKLLRRYNELVERAESVQGIPVLVDGKVIGYAATEDEADAMTSRALGFWI
jgi:hypothetical protein